MNGLSFFLGSSNTDSFSAINGYFYGARVHINSYKYRGTITEEAVLVDQLDSDTSAFLSSAELLEAHYASLAQPPAQVCDEYSQNVQPGTSQFDTLCNAEDLNEMDFFSDQHAFAQEYAVHGWLKSEPTC
jgi:hypothetical protein